MTFAPACAKAVAIPSPMPDAAPVTNTVFPASSFTRILPVQADTLAPKRQVPRTPYDRVFERLESVPEVRLWHNAELTIEAVNVRCRGHADIELASLDVRV